MTTQVNSLSSPFVENPYLKGGAAAQWPSPYLRHASNWQDMVNTAQNDDVELVLWKRSLNVLSAANVKTESDFEILLGTPESILPGFNAMFDLAAWPEALREIVRRDIRQFLEAFETVLFGSHYRVRLQAVSDDACRKFHQDRTFQRLIITYRGDGTVWQDVSKTCQQQAGEMECVLLRGKRIGRDSKILHRSPVFRTGQSPRLIMVIDVMPGPQER